MFCNYLTNKNKTIFNKKNSNIKILNLICYKHIYLNISIYLLMFNYNVILKPNKTINKYHANIATKQLLSKTKNPWTPIILIKIQQQKIHSLVQSYLIYEQMPYRACFIIFFKNLIRTPRHKRTKRNERKNKELKSRIIRFKTKRRRRRSKWIKTTKLKKGKLRFFKKLLFRFRRKKYRKLWIIFNKKKNKVIKTKNIKKPMKQIKLIIKSKMRKPAVMINKIKFLKKLLTYKINKYLYNSLVKKQFKSMSKKKIPKISIVKKQFKSMSKKKKKVLKTRKIRRITKHFNFKKTHKKQKWFLNTTIALYRSRRWRSIKKFKKFYKKWAQKNKNIFSNQFFFKNTQLINMSKFNFFKRFYKRFLKYFTIVRRRKYLKKIKYFLHLTRKVFIKKYKFKLKKNLQFFLNKKKQKYNYINVHTLQTSFRNIKSQPFDKISHITSPSLISISLDNLNSFLLVYNAVKKKKNFIFLVQFNLFLYNVSNSINFNKYFFKKKISTKKIKSYFFKYLFLSTVVNHVKNSLQHEIYFNLINPMSLKPFIQKKKNIFIFNKTWNFINKSNKKYPINNILNKIVNKNDMSKHSLPEAALITNYTPAVLFTWISKSNNRIYQKIYKTVLNKYRLRAYYLNVNEPVTRKFKNFMIFFLISFLEKYLHKKIWVRFNSKNPIKRKFRQYIKIFFKKHNHKYVRFAKILNVHILLDILTITSLTTDLTMFLMFIRQTLEKIHFKKHKKILNLLFDIIKKNKSFFFFLGIKGFSFDIRGKVGVSGNAKKRHSFFSIGKITNTTQKIKSYQQQINVWTPTGQMGITCTLLY